MIVLRRAYLTIFELLLVLAILSITGGVMGISIQKAMQEQKFRNEVNLVVNQLRLAQDLMLITHGDVHFKIKQQADGLEYWLEFDHPLPKLWKRDIQRKGKLTAIRAINFADGSASDELDFKFMSGGAVMSRGLARFAQSEKMGRMVLERYVWLSGYPAPIVSVAEYPRSDLMKEEEAFDAELTQRTRDEIDIHEEEQNVEAS